MFSEKPIQPLKSAGPLFKSGSGDHFYPASKKFDANGPHYTPNGRHYLEASEGVPQEFPSRARVKTGGNFRTDFFGEWPFDPVTLMKDLVEGRITLGDEELQKIALDWFESEDYNLFFNTETNERIYCLCSKRGNVVSCAKKSKQRKALSDAVESKVFDWPVSGTRSDRMTRLLFVTLTFDHTILSKERAWASLRASPIEDCDTVTGVINNFEANIRKIFGPLCKLVCKEATSEGWPAPHIIFLLDEPVRVRLHKGKAGSTTWRLVDRRILRRIGKDPSMRSLYRRAHSEAISKNPIWKFGFFDLQGIVKGSGFGRFKNEVTYLFKYLTKCFTGEAEGLTASLRSFRQASPDLRTMLFTHLGNKCFRTRDISFGRSFKLKVGLLPSEVKPSSVRWKRVRTIPGFVHEKIMEIEERRTMSRMYDRTSSSKSCTA